MSKRLKAAAVAAAFLLSGILCSCSDCDNLTPVERNGQLHVEGSALVNEDGEAVQLCGMSCCDINSCYEFFSDEVCDTLISEWGCTVIRLPVTVRSLDNGYIHFPEYYYEEVCEYADALIAFWDGKSKGTKHMIQTMRLNKKPYMIFNYYGNRIDETGKEIDDNGDYSLACPW